MKALYVFMMILLVLVAPVAAKTIIIERGGGGSSVNESDPLWSGNSSTVARTGVCGDGEAVQNTTTTGVECVTMPSGGGGGSPGGSDHDVQFNDAGSFGGASGVSWNDGTSTFEIGSSSTISSPDSGTFSEKYGLYAEALGQSTLAVGRSAYANKYGCTSLGHDANCSAVAGTAQGVAIGNGAKAYNPGCTVIGSLAVCEGTDSILLGRNTYSDATGSVVIGGGSEASSQNSIAIGANSYSNLASVAVGPNTNGSARAVAIGDDAEALASGSIAIGRRAESAGWPSVSIGQDSIGSSNSVIIGSNTKDNGYTNVIAIGYLAQATGNYQAMFSSSQHRTNHVFFGRGEQSASGGRDYTIYATSGSGANDDGANVNLAGGRGTGSGPGGYVALQYSPSGASGSSMNSLSDGLVLEGDGDVKMDTDTFFMDESANSVGIETSSPARNLHVVDTMRLEPRSGAPSSGALGDLYVDSDSNELCFHDGTSWTGLKAGGVCA